MFQGNGSHLYAMQANKQQHSIILQNSATILQNSDI